MKRCAAFGCVNPSQSHGYCFRHGYLRTDERRPKRVIKKPSEPKAVSTPTFGFEDQTSMFLWLWDQAKDAEGYVFCPYTGKRLNGFWGSDVWFQCFAHILNKKNYTYFKLNPENVRVVHPIFHRIIDQGTLDDRKGHPVWKWDEWDALVIAMKEEYQNFKIKNLLR